MARSPRDRTPLSELDHAVKVFAAVVTIQCIVTAVLVVLAAIRVWRVLQ
jgi:hypothetical protein